MLAVRAKEAKAGTVPDTENVETITTGINMPQDLHALLRAVALKRAKERGSRPSVSAILVELARARESELRRERTAPGGRALSRANRLVVSDVARAPVSPRVRFVGPQKADFVPFLFVLEFHIIESDRSRVDLLGVVIRDHLQFDQSCRGLLRAAEE